MTAFNTIILTDHSVQVHIKNYLADRETYLETITEQWSNAAVLKSITTENRTATLLVLLLNREREFLRKVHQYLDLPEVERAVRILDAPRYLRQINRKLAIVRRRSRVRHWTTLKTATEALVQANNVQPYTLSLTRSRRTLVREWCRSITAENLQYRAHLFSVDLWKRMADVVHPKKSDFRLNWFLEYCFGGEAPENSLTSVMSRLTTENFGELYRTYDLPYECIRLSSVVLKPDDRELVIAKESLDTIIWNWTELSCPQGETILQARLETADQEQLSTLTYGKLVTLLINSNTPSFKRALVSIAERKLRDYRMRVPQPLAVLCDASGSMQVAIKTSSIITSLLSALGKAELQVFKERNYPINNPPRTVTEAVEFASTMRAERSTAPAASLQYYYEQRKVVKTFIIVTDEGENTPCGVTMSWSCANHLTQEGYFAKLYQKYCQEIYPADLIFVSFTEQNKDGIMVAALKEVLGAGSRDAERITVHKFDVRRPDLNRLDYLLQQLSISETETGLTSSAAL